ncbi:MAG: SPFH domain-containing protein [Planctomycetota bacterium]|nr:SPFH domain-containing protein [Planctomycetota bacterium]
MLIETLQFFTGVFVVVYDGQHALKFELGRAKNVVGPGLHFKWPIIQKFKVKDTRDTTLDLEPQIIQLADDLVYEVDTKLIYRITDLRRAMIEVDDLEKGLKNRVTIAIQRVVKAQRRETIGQLQNMVDQVLGELKVIEEEWGIEVQEFGFSNFAPTPATLEVTQLRLLAEEKLSLYKELREEGLGQEASVSLISGAVITMRPEQATGYDRDWNKEKKDEEKTALEEMLEEEEESISGQVEDVNEDDVDDAQ